MKQYEYMLIAEFEMVSSVELNKYGLAGWELVAVSCNHIKDYGNQHVAYLKREIKSYPHDTGRNKKRTL